MNRSRITATLVGLMIVVGAPVPLAAPVFAWKHPPTTTTVPATTTTIPATTTTQPLPTTTVPPTTLPATTIPVATTVPAPVPTPHVTPLVRKVLTTPTDVVTVPAQLADTGAPAALKKVGELAVIFLIVGFFFLIGAKRKNA